MRKGTRVNYRRKHSLVITLQREKRDHTTQTKQKAKREREAARQLDAHNKRFLVSTAIEALCLELRSLDSYATVVKRGSRSKVTRAQAKAMA